MLTLTLNCFLRRLQNGEERRQPVRPARPASSDATSTNPTEGSTPQRGGAATMASNRHSIPLIPPPPSRNGVNGATPSRRQTLPPPGSNRNSTPATSNAARNVVPPPSNPPGNNSPSPATATRSMRVPVVTPPRNPPPAVPGASARTVTPVSASATPTGPLNRPAYSRTAPGNPLGRYCYV